MPKTAAAEPPWAPPRAPPLRALIVDDELYVRQEIRRLDAWERHGIRIAGEAENAPDALRFLEDHAVDLLITDLSMPGLSGIAYLREIRRRFPDLDVVVLTMHRDFDLIQEAMRLGVDDYITKEQFDQSSIDDILESLITRLRNRPGERCYTLDAVSFLYYPLGAPEAERLDGNFTRCGCLRDDAPLPSDAVRIDVSGIKGMNYRQVLEELRVYVETELFYGFVPGRRRYPCALKSASLWGSAPARNPGQGELRRRLEGLTMTADWILDGKLFDELLSGIPRIRLPRDQLTAFLYQPVLRAAQYIKLDASRYFAKTQEMRWWHDWKLWLLDIRERLQGYMSAESAAVHGIHRAIQYTQEHFLENLHIDGVIKIAAMSKSHFSPLFKEITGFTFVDYLKNLRIDYAKRLLVETGRSITQIGEDCGYSDERYFRRLFLKTVGVSPVRYRHDGGYPAKR